MHRLITGIIFSLLFVIGSAQSINPVFRHISRSNGLPVDEVNCITQDATGFMWFGTKEGLYRYDGFSFRGFYNKPGDPLSIPGNYISQVYTDTEGLLWILTNRSGIAVMNGEGKVMQVLNTMTNPIFAGLDYSSCIREDNNGFFWCSTYNGLFKLQKDRGVIKILRQVNFTQKHHPTNGLGNFVFDKAGKLWICTLNGLAIYDPAKDILYNKKNNPFHWSVFNDQLAFGNIYLDEGNGKLWYNTWEPATRVFDLKTGITTAVYSRQGSQLPDFSQMVNQFVWDSHNNLWMATAKGLTVFMNNTKKTFFHEKNNLYSIISSDVRNLFEDREGNFWFATGEGISITRPFRQLFLNLSSNSEKEYSFAGKNVQFILPVDSNTLLISADRLYETDSRFTIRKSFYFGTMDDWLWTYYKDEVHKQIYISTQTGMLLYDQPSHTIQKLLTPPFDEHLPVSSFVKASDGNVWMSRYKNVFFKYNLENKKFKKYSLDGLGEEPQILSLFSDRDQNLWIKANTAGLLHFDERAGRIIEKIVANPGTKQGILQPEILCLLDIGKYFFIGYETRGFSLYDKAFKTFQHFSKADGLSANFIAGAIVTKNGNLWIATPNGISRFDTATKAFINLNYDNGILNNNFQCITQLPDGRIAAGNNKGLVLFHPDSININRNVPAPIITDINIYGRKISTNIYSGHLPLHISYKENYFSIEFISLMYQNNQQVEYAYLLSGLDETWVPAGNRRFVSYSNLKGGDYLFKLRARLPGGEWVESKMALLIIIHPAFYTQWWFYLSIALVFVLIVYGIYRYRLQQIIRMEKMRMAISSDLHDEVGATLSSISIFSEMAKQSVGQPSKAEPYLQRIGERSRESIEKMSDIIWSINPENDGMNQMLERMKNYANEMLEAKNMGVHWVESENISLLKLSMSQRKNLYLLFKEVINNAAKYSGACNVQISLRTDRKSIQLSVEDDGTGFDLKTVTPGNGIKNIQRRAALLNGKAVVASGAAGTSVSLAFPV